MHEIAQKVYEKCKKDLTEKQKKINYAYDQSTETLHLVHIGITATGIMILNNFLYMIAQFQTKSVYGNDLIYPMNDTATKLVQLTGRKTIDKVQLKTIQSLGFTIEFLALSPL